MSVAALTQIKAIDIAVRNAGRMQPLLECGILEHLQLPVSSVFPCRFPASSRASFERHPPPIGRCSHDNRVQCGAFLLVSGDANLKVASEGPWWSLHASITCYRHATVTFGNDCTPMID